MERVELKKKWGRVELKKKWEERVKHRFAGHATMRHDVALSVGKENPRCPLLNGSVQYDEPRQHGANRV